MQIGKKYLQGHGRKLPKTVGKTSLFVKHIFEKSGQDEMYQFDSASLVYLRPLETAVEEEKKTAPEEERAREYVLREKETMKLITKEEKIREFPTNVIKESVLPSALDMLREKSFRKQLSVQLELLLKECQEIEHRTKHFANHEEMGQIWQKFREERYVLEQYRKDWNDVGSRQEGYLQKEIKEHVEHLSLYRTMLEKKEQEIVRAKTVLHKIQMLCLEDTVNLKTRRFPMEEFPHSEMTDRTMSLEETQIQKAAEEIGTVIQRILEIQTKLEENRELSGLQTENLKTQNVKEDNEFNGFNEMQKILELEAIKQKQILLKELSEETTIGSQEIIEQIYQLFSELSKEERIKIKQEVQQILAELSEEEQEVLQEESQKEALQKEVKQRRERNTESSLRKVLLEEIVTIFSEENEGLKTFLENEKKAKTDNKQSKEKKAETQAELRIESPRNTENAEAAENIEDTVHLKTRRFPIEEFPHSEMTDRTMPLVLEETQIQKSAEEIGTVIQRILEIQTKLEENREAIKQKEILLKELSEETTIVSQEVIEQIYLFMSELSKEERMEIKQEVQQQETVLKEQIAEFVKSYQTKKEDRTAGQEIRHGVQQIFAELSEEEQKVLQKEALQKEVRQRRESPRNTENAEAAENIEDTVHLKTRRFPIEEFPHSEMTDRTMPIVLEETQIQKAAEEIGTVIQRILEIQTKLEELEAIKQKQVLFKELSEETTIGSQEIIEQIYQLFSELSKEERIKIKQEVQQQETVLKEQIAEFVKSYQTKREDRTAGQEIRRGVQQIFAELSEEEQEVLQEESQKEALQKEVRQRIERNTESSLRKVLLEEIVTIFMEENKVLETFLEKEKKAETYSEQSNEKKAEKQAELQIENPRNTENAEAAENTENNIEDEINLKTRRFPIEEFPHSEMTDRTTPFVLEGTQIQKAAEEIRTVIQKILEIQTKLEENRELSELQTENVKTESVKIQNIKEDNEFIEFNGFNEMQEILELEAVKQKQVLLKKLSGETTIVSQEVIEHIYQLLSELSKEERIELRREVQQQETVLKEQILEFAEFYQVKKNGKSIEQKVQQILTELSEEEQEVLRNELKQRMDGKTEIVPAKTLLSEIRMIFLEEFLETTKEKIHREDIEKKQKEHKKESYLKNQGKNDEINKEENHFLVEEFPNSKMLDKTISTLSEKQIQEAVQEIETVMQRILEFQTNVRMKDVSQELQEILKIEDVELTVENKVIRQNIIEKVYHLLSELNEEEWVEVKQEVQQKKLVSKEQILEFAESYSMKNEEKLIGRKMKQNVRQILNELSEEEQEVLRSELEQKMIRKLSSVHTETILNEIRMGFLEESEVFDKTVFKETVYEQIQEQVFELTKDSQIQELIEQRELHTQKERKQQEERLQHYQNQTEKVEQLREEQQKQFRMLQEASQQQAEQLVKIENWQQEIRQRLLEQEEAQPLKNQEEKTLRKFQEQLRLERLRRGLI